MFILYWHTTKCDRCKLVYRDEEFESCPHCVGMTDEEALEHGVNWRHQRAGSLKGVATLYFLLAIAGAGLFLYAYLYL